MQVRAAFGADDETFAALSELYRSRERWDDLARLVLEQTRNLDVERAVDGIELRLRELRGQAEVLVHRVSDRALAAAVCEALFDAGARAWRPPLSNDPGADGARLWAETTWWALDELVRLSLESRDYETAVRRMLEGSRLVFDPTRARQMRKHAAELVAEQLGDAARAVEIYRELLAADDGDGVAQGAIPELGRLLAEIGAFAELTSLWERQATRQQESTPLAAELWARAADLAEKRLNDVDRAITDWAESARAGHPSAYRELARLHAQRGDPLRAAEALERLSYQASQEHLTADTLALVDAYLAAGRRDLARARLERAAQIAVQPRAIRARLRKFYEEDRDFAKLADLACAEALEAEDKPSRLRLLREAADLHIDRRSDPAAAIPLLEQAKKLDPARLDPCPRRGPALRGRERRPARGARGIRLA
jgi:hypothetical protein